MMISPSCFIETKKNMSYAELVEEKDKLIAEINRFERGEIYPKERAIAPSPEVVYQCNLSYLAELCKLIVDKYHDEVVWAGINDDE